MNVEMFSIVMKHSASCLVQSILQIPCLIRYGLSARGFFTLGITLHNNLIELFKDRFVTL